MQEKWVGQARKEAKKFEELWRKADALEERAAAARKPADKLAERATAARKPAWKAAGKLEKLVVKQLVAAGICVDEREAFRAIRGVGLRAAVRALRAADHVAALRKLLQKVVARLRKADAAQAEAQSDKRVFRVTEHVTNARIYDVEAVSSEEAERLVERGDAEPEDWAGDFLDSVIADVEELVPAVNAAEHNEAEAKPKANAAEAGQ